jgi:hypothetical protein
MWASENSNGLKITLPALLGAMSLTSLLPLDMWQYVMPLNVCDRLMLRWVSKGEAPCLDARHPLVLIASGGHAPLVRWWFLENCTLIKPGCDTACSEENICGAYLNAALSGSIECMAALDTYTVEGGGALPRRWAWLAAEAGLTPLRFPGPVLMALKRRDIFFRQLEAAPLFPRETRPERKDGSSLARYHPPTTSEIEHVLGLRAPEAVREFSIDDVRTHIFKPALERSDCDVAALALEWTERTPSSYTIHTLQAWVDDIGNGHSILHDVLHTTDLLLYHQWIRMMVVASRLHAMETDGPKAASATSRQRGGTSDVAYRLYTAEAAGPNTIFGLRDVLSRNDWDVHKSVAECCAVPPSRA